MVTPSISIGRAERAAKRFPWLLGATCVPFASFVLAHHVRASGLDRLVAAIGALTLAAHVPATAAFYADRTLWPFMSRHRGRFLIAPAVATLAGTVFAWRASVTLLSTGFSAFVAWQLHHFTKQNLGMLSFLLRAKRRPAVTRAERSMITLTGVAGILGFAPLYSNLPGIDDQARRLLWWLGLLALGAAAVVLIRAWPSDALRAAALSGIVLFYAPLFVYKGGQTVTTIAYSTVHGAQYLLMAGHLAAGRSRLVAARWIAALAVLVVVAGQLLEETGGLADGGLRWLFGLGLGVTAAHFIVDAGLWRLREPDQRSWMRERFAFL